MAASLLGVLQNDCGGGGGSPLAGAAELLRPTQQTPSPLQPHHRSEGYPDALAPGGEHTDGRAGRVAKAGPGLLSAQQPVCLCKCPPGEGGGGEDGWMEGGLMWMDC